MYLFIFLIQAYNAQSFGKISFKCLEIINSSYLWFRITLYFIKKIKSVLIDRQYYIYFIFNDSWYALEQPPYSAGQVQELLTLGMTLEKLNCDFKDFLLTLLGATHSQFICLELWIGNYCYFPPFFYEKHRKKKRRKLKKLNEIVFLQKKRKSGLVLFYGRSTILGYLMPNPVFTLIYIRYVWFVNTFWR